MMNITLRVKKSRHPGGMTEFISGNVKLRFVTLSLIGFFSEDAKSRFITLRVMQGRLAC